MNETALKCHDGRMLSKPLKTADGVDITPNMTVYFIKTDYEDGMISVAKTTVKSLHYKGSVSVNDKYLRYCSPKSLYSTYRSCAISCLSNIRLQKDKLERAIEQISSKM